LFGSIQHNLQVLLVAALTTRSDYLFLAGEVAVHCPWAECCLPANVLHGSLVKTLPGETSGGSVQDLLTARLQVGDEIRLLTGSVKSE